MFNNDNDNLFDGFFDRDFDGDVDFSDQLIEYEEFEELLDEEDKRGNESSMFEDDDFEDDGLDDDDGFEDDDLDDEIDNDNNDYNGEFIIPIKITWGDGEDKETSKKSQKSPALTGLEKRRAIAQGYLNYVQRTGDRDNEEKIKRCEFIVNSRKEAAKYLTENGIFLYSQAIKDNFQIHFDFPEEIDCVKLHFELLFKRLTRHDMSQAINIWEWCLDTFMPYVQYAENDCTLTSYVIYDNNIYPDSFLWDIVSHMANKPDFIGKLLSGCIDSLRNVEDLIEVALECGHVEIAKTIMNYSMNSTYVDVYEKELLINNCIRGISNRDDLEPMELFQKYIFPLAVNDADEYIRFCIPKWEKEMNDHIEYAETHFEKYAYSRRFAWREKYRGSEVNPTRYDTEEKYLEAVFEQKYGWRKYCSNRFRIDPNNYETREEYKAAVEEAYAEERRVKAMKRAADPFNMTLYEFCKVCVTPYEKPYYYYFTGGLELKVGDRVVVPFGEDNKLIEGVVMAVGECYGCAFPCHVNGIKTVVEKNKC